MLEYDLVRFFLRFWFLFWFMFVLFLLQLLSLLSLHFSLQLICVDRVAWHIQFPIPLKLLFIWILGWRQCDFGAMMIWFLSDRGNTQPTAAAGNNRNLSRPRGANCSNWSHVLIFIGVSLPKNKTYIHVKYLYSTPILSILITCSHWFLWYVRRNPNLAFYFDFLVFYLAHFCRLALHLNRFLQLRDQRNPRNLRQSIPQARSTPQTKNASL